MKIGTFGLIGAAALASAANAEFLGWETELITLVNGHTIMNVYAKFDNSGDRVVNVYDAAITTNTAGGFYQSAGQPYWQVSGTQNKMTSDDSYVCIGTNPNGNGNPSGSITAGDPSFVNYNAESGTTTYDFSVIEGSGTGAGWYNNNPGNTWGFANTGDNRVLVAHFVATSAQGADAVNWNATLTITKAGFTGSFTRGAGQNTFAWIIPGPGAMAFLGLAGLASRRRRA